MVGASIASLPAAFTCFAVARWEGGLFLVHFFAYNGFVVLAATEHDALEGVRRQDRWQSVDGRG